MFGKLLGLLSLGGTVASVTMLQRFLAGLTGVIALTIVSALMAAVLLCACFAGIYIGLTRSGLDPDIALLAVGLLILLTTVASGWLALIKLKHLRELPFAALHNDIPSLSKLGGIANAFLDGLAAGHSHSVPPRSGRR